MFLKWCVIFAICIYKISCELVTFQKANEMCLESFNFTRGEFHNWNVGGLIPRRNETFKCFFECLYKTADVVDSNSVPNKEKMNEMADRARNMSKSNIGIEILASDIVWEKCMPTKDTSNSCDINYNFAVCAKLVHKIIIIGYSEEAKKNKTLLETDLRLLDLKSIYFKTLAPSINVCKRLKSIEKELF